MRRHPLLRQPVGRAAQVPGGGRAHRGGYRRRRARVGCIRVPGRAAGLISRRPGLPGAGQVASPSCLRGSPRLGRGPSAWHCRADRDVPARATAGRPYWPHRSRPFPRWRLGFVLHRQARPGHARFQRRRRRCPRLLGRFHRHRGPGISRVAVAWGTRNTVDRRGPRFRCLATVSRSTCRSTRDSEPGQHGRMLPRKFDGMEEAVDEDQARPGVASDVPAPP